VRYLENKTFDEIRIGDQATLTRTLRLQDIELFTAMSGDVDPAHVDADYARGDALHTVVADGMWGGALISALLGTELPGPGTICLEQSLRFHRPVALGDEVVVGVSVRGKDAASGEVTLDCSCRNRAGDLLIEGQARVRAPTIKIRRPRAVLPEIHVHERGARYAQLIAATRDFAPLLTAVVHPCDELSLSGAIEAQRKQLI
jgi:acyl dehydratase